MSQRADRIPPRSIEQAGTGVLRSRCLMGADVTSDWKIVVHSAERILEVIYPSDPTADALERYEQEIRAAILRLGGTWDCLVDQRAMPVLPAEMSARIADLIVWARARGMR